MPKAEKKVGLVNWLKFLGHAAPCEQNTKLLTEYFERESKKTPELFYDFLISLKKADLTQNMAQQYLDVLSPLSERFGFFQVKEKLDDRCFELAYPEDHKRIVSVFADQKEKSKENIERILDTLKKLLKKHGFKCEFKGRYKSSYSIYKKTRLKGKNALELRDLFAFRVVVLNDSVDDCYEILNLLHDTFLPIADSFKDYISIPKINSYQSLHTGLGGVMSGFDVPIEVQIRTQSMDAIADEGLAAHWLYGKEKRSHMPIVKGERVLQHYSDSLKVEQKEFIYFFSYKKELFKMEKGVKIRDFARKIHSELAENARSAVVNSKNVGLNVEVQEGDEIEILVDPILQVKTDWLTTK